MAKTNLGLAEYAKAQLGKPYWYGTFGQAASKSLYDAKKKQYPDYYKWSYAGESGVKVHDCVGLIKGYLWCDSPTDNTPTYNASQDISANMMRSKCTVNGKMNTLPEVVGTLVFMEHHVGVYIGNGYVIEARGHNYGVVKTKLSSRPWTSWGYCPYIYYEQKPQDTSTATKTVKVELKQLKQGVTGEQVKTLQRLLSALGYNLGGYGADGSFGPKTHSAVLAFQRKTKLTADGIVGENTWNKLLGIK